MTTLQLAPIVMALLLLAWILPLSKRRRDTHRQAVRSLARARDLEPLTPAGSLQSAPTTS